MPATALHHLTHATVTNPFLVSVFIKPISRHPSSSRRLLGSLHRQEPIHSLDLGRHLRYSKDAEFEYAGSSYMMFLPSMIALSHFADVDSHDRILSLTKWQTTARNMLSGKSGITAAFRRAVATSSWALLQINLPTFVVETAWRTVPKGSSTAETPPFSIVPRF